MLDVLDSDLYLQYVIGQIDPELLHTTPERHIRCNPTLAQFIVCDDFAPVPVEGEFAKTNLNPNYVAEQERLISRGWKRLQEIKQMQDVSILAFPLPEVIENFRNRLAES